MVHTGRTPSQQLEYLYSKVGPHYYDRLDLHFPMAQRGAIIQLYPYPFLDLQANGAAAVATSSLMMLGLFAVAAILVVWADRLLPAPHSI